MIFELAYRNLAMARDTASTIDKSDWDFNDLMGHFEGGKGDSKLLAAELLVRHFGAELPNETLISICEIKKMRMNPDLLQLLMSKDKETIREMAMLAIQNMPIGELSFKAMLELCPVEDLKSLALERISKLKS